MALYNKYTGNDGNKVNMQTMIKNKTHELCSESSLSMILMELDVWCLFSDTNNFV